MRVDHRVDLERAAVRVVGLERWNVVGEAVLFAQLLEEPAARTVAKNGVQQLERPLVGIVAPQSRDTQAEVRLLDRALLDHQSRCGQDGGRWRVLGHDASSRAEMAPRQLD